MNSLVATLVNALILFVAIVAAGFLVGGRYTVTQVQAPNSSYLMVTNRFTGSVRICVPQGCKDVGELGTSSE